MDIDLDLQHVKMWCRRIAASWLPTPYCRAAKRGRTTALPVKFVQQHDAWRVFAVHTFAMSLALTCGLLLTPQLLYAQQLGKVVGAEGTPQQFTPQQPIWNVLRWGDDIITNHALKTDSAPRSKVASKAEVLLLRGHKFILADNAQVTIQESRTPQGTKVELLLKVGTVRVVTANAPGSILVTRTATAVATPQRTGYIVSCGPPATPTPDRCLFVGLYGTTDVEAVAAPQQSVRLNRQQFTYVAVNQQPSPNPPQLLADADFAALLTRTTVIGTGASEDRLAVTAGIDDPQNRALLSRIPQVPLTPTILPVIIDQPLSQFDPRLGGVPPGGQLLPDPPPLPEQ